MYNDKKKPFTESSSNTSLTLEKSKKMQTSWLNEKYYYVLFNYQLISVVHTLTKKKLSHNFSLIQAWL